MTEIFAAIATDSGTSLEKKHFGDAVQYQIYEISPNHFRHVKTITNHASDDETHADENKAKGIGGILKKENVKVLASRQFGANIKHMKIKFACVLTNQTNLSDLIGDLQSRYTSIVEEIENGEERNVLNFRK